MAYDFNPIRNPVIKRLLETIFNVTDGHDHDGVNSKAVAVGTVADGAITNAKVAAGIDAAKIADGSVSNTEFQYLNGLTANIQAQFAAISAQIPEGTPVNAVAANGTLTIDGVVIDGETVTIGDEVYEFCADAAQSLTAGSDYAVDIEADTTKSQGTLTVDTQPTVGDTMTIGTKLYTFVAPTSVNGDGDISVGTDAATAQAAIVAAVNGTDGVNAAHPLVTMAAFADNASVITALVGGVAGDLIATTETFTAETNVFDGVKLGTTTAGADCVQADAVTALALSITTNSEIVTGVDGAGDTVVVTYKTKGTVGNGVDTTETMTNGEFGAEALAGGVNGTVGTKLQTYQDTSYVYFCTADNTIADANWRRISLGTAY